jgi:hypothetical protein
MTPKRIDAKTIIEASRSKSRQQEVKGEVAIGGSGETESSSTVSTTGSAGYAGTGPRCQGR